MSNREKSLKALGWKKVKNQKYTITDSQMREYFNKSEKNNEKYKEQFKIDSNNPKSLIQSGLNTLIINHDYVRGIKMINNAYSLAPNDEWVFDQTISIYTIDGKNNIDKRIVNNMVEKFEKFVLTYDGKFGNGSLLTEESSFNAVHYRLLVTLFNELGYYDKALSI